MDRRGERRICECRGKTRQTANGARAMRCDCVLEPAFIGRQCRAVVFRMPEMQDPSRETPVLAADAAAEEAHHDIGVFAAPAAEGGVEPVNAIKIAAIDREVGAARPTPTRRIDFAQRSERQGQESGDPIDAAGKALAQDLGYSPSLWLGAAAENAFR